MRRNPIRLLCCLLLCITACIRPAAALFSDCDGHPAKEYIERAVEQQWFSGDGTQFYPDAPLTREMLAVVLANYASAELPGANSAFTDVPAGSASARAIAWAAKTKIIDKTSEKTFSPDDPVTREQLAVSLVRLANEMQVVLPHIRGRNAIFTDVADCSDGALDAVYTLYRADVIGTNDTVYPKAELTRAECAEILCRYCDACTMTLSEQEEGVVISHKGYWVDAPENTLPAFIMSRQMKYLYIETDVRFTKDNVAVLSHDDTVDRTSNGSGAIPKLTLEQLLAFDFSEMSPQYHDVRITTFEQFIQFCAKNYIHPVVELKGSMTDAQINQLFAIVGKYDMTEHVTWISFDYTNLQRIQRLYPSAEMSYLSIKITEQEIEKTKQLKTEQNNVYLSAKHENVTNKARALCIRSRVYLQLWTIADRQLAIQNLNTCTVGITVDTLTRKDIFSGT